MSWTRGGFALLAGLAAACSDSSTGPAAAAAVRLAPFDSGYDFSVFVAAPPGDTSRLFVVERGGRIRLR